VTAFRFSTFTFWNYYVLQLLRFETITFSDATLSDIKVVLCYVLSQYPENSWKEITTSSFSEVTLSNFTVMLRLSSGRSRGPEDFRQRVLGTVTITAGGTVCSRGLGSCMTGRSERGREAPRHGNL
jgi:hypothetical protein